MQHAEASSSIATATAHARIEPELRSRLAALARANDRSLAAEIRRAIAGHVEREATSDPAEPHERGEES